MDGPVAVMLWRLICVAGGGALCGGCAMLVTLGAAAWARGEGAPGVAAAVSLRMPDSDDEPDYSNTPVGRLHAARRAAGQPLRPRGIFCHPHDGVKIYSDGVAAVFVAAPLGAIAGLVGTVWWGPQALPSLLCAVAVAASVLGYNSQ